MFEKKVLVGLGLPKILKVTDREEPGYNIISLMIGYNIEIKTRSETWGKASSHY